MLEEWRVWKCPKCARTVEAMAIQVAHRCPANRLKITLLVLTDQSSELASPTPQLPLSG